MPDHPLSYGNFEGVIPEGQYGAGLVVVWDRGTYVAGSDDPAGDLERGKLSFTLRGRKLMGGFTLVRLRRGDGQWLLIKQADELARRGWKISSALTPARRKKLRGPRPADEAD